MPKSLQHCIICILIIACSSCQSHHGYGNPVGSSHYEEKYRQRLDEVIRINEADKGNIDQYQKEFERQLLLNEGKTISVGIPSSKLDFTMSRQLTEVWCWSACLETIFRGFGLTVDQEVIARNTHGVNRHGQIRVNPGSDREITRNLNNLSIDKNGVVYGVRAQYGRGAPDPMRLLGELIHGYPVMVGYDTGQNIGHAVLITGCEFTIINQRIVIEKITVRDPYPTRENRRKFGRNDYVAIDFYNLIRSWWIVRVEVLN